MAWFKKKNDVLDLTERYRKQQEKIQAVKTEQASTSQTSTGGFGVFGMATPTPTTSSSSENSGYVDVSSTEDKKKKLAKRLMAITDKLEEMSNQLYHLQQRVELLEQKNKVGY